MKTLVIAPHPDDEVLGCGGTLLRRVSNGVNLAWLLMTSISEEDGWSRERVDARRFEINKVRTALGIPSHQLYEMNFSAAKLDQLPMDVMVSRMSVVFREFEPNEILIPFPGDAHSDHSITFQVAAACTKWFRYPSVNRVLVYETPSETDFGIDPRSSGFKPNFFVDITDFVKDKIQIANIYSSEMGAFPFPRSSETLQALGMVRGSQAGYTSAEAFMLLKERS